MSIGQGCRRRDSPSFWFFCSCFPTVFLRIQATLCSCTLSLPIFVWLYKTHRTLCWGESCQTNGRSPSLRVKMIAETYKPRGPDELVIWKQEQQYFHSILQKSGIPLHHIPSSLCLCNLYRHECVFYECNWRTLEFFLVALKGFKSGTITARICQWLATLDYP